MKSRFQFSQKLGQKLTPQLQMAVKLLYYTRAELDQEIENALAGNPVLERVEEPAETLSLQAMDADDPAPAQDSEAQAELDVLYGHDANEILQSPWDSIAEPVSLSGHLLGQLHLSALNARDRRIGEALIDSLNDDGYCTAPFDDIRRAADLTPTVDDAEIETVRHLLQQFDPLAVASKDLSECLLLQLAYLDAPDDVLGLARDIAEHHLDALAKTGPQLLAKSLGISAERIGQAVNLLKTLNPKPGAAFQNSRTEYLEPDFIAVKIRKHWQIRPVSEPRHQLRINAVYRKLAKQTASTEARLLAPYLQEAQWLIASIASRQETLKRVAETIAQKQQAFLESGISALQSMRMHEVADAIGVHESTVSRACSGKYLATAHGIYEFKRLFRTGIAREGGDSLANDALQARIIELISRENAARPLSDAQLEKLLTAEGQPIARRTVAKYREAARIPPSHSRRKPA